MVKKDLEGKGNGAISAFYQRLRYADYLYGLPEHAIGSGETSEASYAEFLFQ